MIWLDFIIVAAYAAALLKTKRQEYLVCLLAMLFSLCFCWTVAEMFSVKNNGIECLYYISLSAIWLFAVASIKNKNKSCIAIFIMSIYEFICGVESFIWQFVSPVVTPIFDYYIFNVIAIHLIILISIYKWSVNIERDTSYIVDNFNARIHH